MPHESLLRLLPTLSFAFTGTPLEQAGQPYRLKAQSRQKVLSWSQQYGLLGVLLHRVDEVTYPYRWKRSPGALKRMRDGNLYIQQSRFIHGITRWMDIGEAIWDTTEIEGPARVGEVVDPDCLPRKYPPPGVGIVDLTSGGAMSRPRPRWEPLSETWARYFPSIPEGERDTFDYPEPASMDFWRLYAEPVNDFIRAAKLLEHIPGLLVVEEKMRTASDAEAEADGLEAQHCHMIHSLNLLRLGTTSGFSTDEKGMPEERWVSPSLLRMMGNMVTQEFLTGKWRVLTCKRCGTVFTSKGPRAAYCSQRCQRTEEKRRYRARKAAGDGSK